MENAALMAAAAETFATAEQRSAVAAAAAAASDLQLHKLEEEEEAHFQASIHLIFEVTVAVLALPGSKPACREQRPYDSLNPEASLNTVVAHAEQSQSVVAAAAAAVDAAAAAVDTEAFDSKTSVASSLFVEWPPIVVGSVAVGRSSWVPVGPCMACTACQA